MYQKQTVDGKWYRFVLFVTGIHRYAIENIYEKALQACGRRRTKKYALCSHKIAIRYFTSQADKQAEPSCCCYQDYQENCTRAPVQVCGTLSADTPRTNTTRAMSPRCVLMINMISNTNLSVINVIIDASLFETIDRNYVTKYISSCTSRVLYILFLYRFFTTNYCLIDKFDDAVVCTQGAIAVTKPYADENSRTAS